ncbi:pentapeptide repeat-containing protein [Catellatospora sichuanensis]|uniref:pentapeptide repeat-containing protein n=1 Tax=Catellatospora sichuanensis TaxID=1969805 RepID=UPI001642F049|nr:pentapeptide repeat-containing protein [Catellatospora sichuanensis]
MASVEAVERLLAGENAWQTYINEAPERAIDLTFADLRGADLRRRTFRRCDLTGAQMTNANLDGSTFQTCQLSAVSLDNASLVACRLTELHATDLSLRNAVVRETTLDQVVLSVAAIDDATFTRCQLTACRFEGLSMDRTTFTNTKLHKTTIRDAAASHTRLDACTFEGCEVTNLELSEPSICECVFRACDIAEWNLSLGFLRSCAMTESRIRRLHITGTEVTTLNLSGSIVQEIDLSQIGPSTATLLDTALIGCVWPNQTGKVSVTGRYSPSPSLLGQPVQDIKGVPPIIRRATADAQYLTRKLDLATGRMARIMFRLWGATSAYGQSVGRLAWCSLLVILIHTLALLATRGQIFGTYFHPNLLGKAFGLSILSFLGLSGTESPATSAWEQAIIISVRILGFVGLGIWVSISANKLNKLSSE